MQAKPAGTRQPIGKQNQVGWWDFGLIGLITLALIGLAALGELIPFLGPLRLAPGLIFVLYVPGYCLTAALFPRVDDVDGIERTGINLGLSVAVVPLLALALDALPWGIRLWPVLLGECVLTITFMVVAAWRRIQLPAGEAYAPLFSWHPHIWWRAQSALERRIYLVLLGALLLGGFAVAWTFLAPSEAEFMTEFYLLGPQGLAEGFPREVPARERLTVTAGVTNREQGQAAYAIVVRSGHQVLAVTQPFPLAKGETWEGPLTFTMPFAQEDQLVEIFLSRDGQPFPYRTLRLWLDVTPAP